MWKYLWSIREKDQINGPFYPMIPCKSSLFIKFWQLFIITHLESFIYIKELRFFDFFWKIFWNIVFHYKVEAVIGGSNLAKSNVYAYATDCFVTSSENADDGEKHDLLVSS